MKRIFNLFVLSDEGLSERFSNKSEKKFTTSIMLKSSGKIFIEWLAGQISEKNVNFSFEYILRAISNFLKDGNFIELF